MAKRGIKYPDGCTFHTAIWKKLSSATKAELMNVRTEAMAEISLSSSPGSLGTSNTMASTLTPNTSTTALPHSEIPRQYPRSTNMTATADATPAPPPDGEVED